MVRAAQHAGVCPQQHRVARCGRRVRDVLLQSVPVWVQEMGDSHTALLEWLARCRVQQQPWKVAHEPRKVRTRPRPFPPLRGDRATARQEARAALGAVDDPAEIALPGTDPPTAGAPGAADTAPHPAPSAPRDQVS